MLAVFLPALLLYSLTHFPYSLADEGPFTLTYNGGNIMTRPVTVDLLWFGDGWQEPDRDTIRNSIASLTSSSYLAENYDVPTLRNWWDIVKQYKDGSGMPVTSSVSLGVECSYTGSPINVTLDQVTHVGQSLFNKTSIDGFGRNLSCTEVFDVGDDTIYLIVFSNWVMFLDANEQMALIDRCSGDLGELDVMEGRKVKMLWTRAPQKDTDQCSSIFGGDSYLGPPNGDKKIDSLVSYTLAKIAEEATNRDGRGWSSSSGDDSSGLSISGVCSYDSSAADSPLFKDAERNLSFNVIGVNGYRYMVQHIWDLQIRNCAMKLSESCEAGTVTLTQPKGYLSAGISVNHTNGLQPYPPNQKCQWKIQYPSAKFIAFSLSYLSIGADDGLLTLCKSGSIPVDCCNIHNDNSGKHFKLRGSTAYVEFTTGDGVSAKSRGWELSYSAGFCDGKEHIYNRNGIIGYTQSTGFSYVEGLSCQWVLHGKPGTLVSLNFTHINTSKELDFLAIYDSTEKKMDNQVCNFSGLFLGSDLPQINLTGKVMIVFTTQTDQGTGWSASFYISSPVSRHMSPVLIAIIVSTALLVVFSLVLITLAVFRQRRRLREKVTNMDEKLKLLKVEVNREENCIGEGPSAIVYKAILANGCMVAVKSQRDTKAETDLEEEILVKTSSHPNIISLLGYARNGSMGRKLLVFEFMGRGNLSWNLRERGEFLSWEKRLDIAFQISAALQLLHMYSIPPIFHGNLGSENVLLDDSWNAKLAGFGTGNYCRNSGPDPGNQSKLVEDVLNFGLLLVELLRGETVVKGYSPGFFELVEDQEWLDPRLEIPGEESKIIGLAKLGEIAKWCMGGRRDRDYNTSPKMGEVVLGLKQVKQLFGSVMS